MSTAGWCQRARISTALAVSILSVSPVRADDAAGALLGARALPIPILDMARESVAVAVPLQGTDDRAIGHGGVCQPFGSLPSSVRVAAELRPSVQVMLERSPTFRAQCRQLAAAPWVHVAVRLGPYFLDRQGYRAYTIIQRPQPRLVVARVTLQSAVEPSLWIGHEFEHLVEQIDNVNVRRQANLQRDAWHTRSGMVETDRAVRAGHHVFDEVRRLSAPVRPGPHRDR